MCSVFEQLQETQDFRNQECKVTINVRREFKNASIDTSFNLSPPVCVFTTGLETESEAASWKAGAEAVHVFVFDTTTTTISSE